MPAGKQEAVVEPVPSKEEKKEEKAPPSARKPAGGGAKGKDKKAEMSDEEKAKKEEVELLVERIQDADVNLQKAALDIMLLEIKSTSTSMTSVPLMLKFLRLHFDTLKAQFEKTPNDNANKKTLANVISILAMTMGAAGTRESLKYYLLGERQDIGSWGHEYVRNLAAEVIAEYTQRQTAATDVTPDVSDLLSVVDEIVPFHMKHHAEPDACDILLELEQLDKIVQYVDTNNYDRVSLYLLSNANYAAEPDDTVIYKLVLKIYQKLNKYPEALVVAMKLDDAEEIKAVFDSCEDRATKIQLASMIGRNRYFSIDLGDDVDDKITEYTGNNALSFHFLELAKSLDILEPKVPEDIYKTHLLDTRYAANLAQQGESARQNLSASFVNGFVNAGFGQDKLVCEEGKSFVFQNKEQGKLSAAASLGLLYLWNVDSGTAELDKLSYSSDKDIKAGALLGFGLVASGLRSEHDPALALLADYVDASSSQNDLFRQSAVLGLGIAYAGHAREDLKEMILPLVEDTNSSVELGGTAALALGLIFVGTANPDIAESITNNFMDREESVLVNSTHTRFLALGLGLIFLGKQSKADVTLEVLQVMENQAAKYAHLTVKTCAYAGTGSVVTIQQLLHVCGEHLDQPTKEETKDEAHTSDNAAKNTDSAASTTGTANTNTGGGGAAAATAASTSAGATAAAGAAEKKQPSEKILDHQAVATLGIALVAMSEEIGEQMCNRAFEHLLQFGDAGIRRAVPLAVGLLSISHPQPSVVDTLSKLSHDSDNTVSQGAIFSLGLVGSGTNNSRIAALLRQLSAYYSKDPEHIFMIRIAQGLLHLGKGTMTLDPVHTHSLLLNRVAVAGVLGVLHATLDLKNLIHQKHHYLLYLLACAINPRMMMTLDSEKLDEEHIPMLETTVRVGQAVDTIGQAGRPKTITGFQTHSTPVLIAAGERVELASEQYIPVSNFLEHLVFIKKNPEWKEDANAAK